MQAVLRRPSKEVSRKGTARPLSLRQSMGVRYGRPRLLDILLNILFCAQSLSVRFTILSPGKAKVEHKLFKTRCTSGQKVPRGQEERRESPHCHWQGTGARKWRQRQVGQTWQAGPEKPADCAEVEGDRHQEDLRLLCREGRRRLR